jgi:hypothetical protein
MKSDLKHDLDYHNRQIIPRWLPHHKKILITTSSKKQSYIPTEYEIEQHNKLRDDWRMNKSISFAVQLVASADILNLTNDEYYKEALFFIKQQNNLITNNELYKNLFSFSTDDYYDILNINQNIRKSIKDIKEKLLVCINDPILWIDLAYYYTISSCKKKAEKCIRVALSLNNYSPYIIRSAVRFFVFCQEPERALYILKNSPNLLSNPLLLSAEISVSEAFHFTTKNAKKGISLLNDGRHSCDDLAELNASIATIECNFGNLKKGKKLINNALLGPNENTLAQIQYLSKRNNLPFSLQQFEVPCRYEANAFNNLYLHNYKDVITETKKWFDFHPFSPRPAMLFSFVNSTFFNGYEESISIIDKTFKLLPLNNLLLNNKAFALAKIGKIKEANDCIKTILSSDRNESDDLDNNTLKATMGLIAYRSGIPDEGRKLYKEAVEHFEKSGNIINQARALFFWSEEEKAYNTEEANKILSKASEITKKYNIQEVQILLDNNIKQTLS